MDQKERGEKLGDQDGPRVFVGHAQPTGLRAVEQGETLHRVHLPDVVGLLGPLVVFRADPAHTVRGQPSLMQPQLQGASGWDQFLGVVLEQVDANACRPPAQVLTAQGTTGLLHGETPGVKRAAAAVEVGRQLGVGRLLLPLREQAADGACGQRHEPSNLWRREALVMKGQDALARFGRCGSRHAERLPGKKGAKGKQAQASREDQGGPNRAQRWCRRDLGWQAQSCLVGSKPLPQRGDQCPILPPPPSRGEPLLRRPLANLSCA